MRGKKNRFGVEVKGKCYSRIIYLAQEQQKPNEILKK